MTNQELQKLREDISASQFLSQIERTEWLQLLPEMNDAQAKELASILQSAATHVQKTAAPAFPRLDEKELPPGIPFLELESAPSVTPVLAVAPAPVVASAPVMHERPAWQASIVQKPQAPVRPLQSAAPATPEFVGDATQPAAHGISMQSIKVPQDLTKLDLPFIRQADPKIVFDNVLHAVVDMTKTYPVTEIAGKVEQSPLYKIYYTNGMSGLNTGTLPATAQSNSLSKEEFEAFTDFRTQMEHIIS
jgi:hypothetical protein